MIQQYFQKISCLAFRLYYSNNPALLEASLSLVSLIAARASLLLLLSSLSRLFRSFLLGKRALLEYGLILISELIAAWTLKRGCQLMIYIEVFDIIIGAHFVIEIINIWSFLVIVFIDPYLVYLQTIYDGHSLQPVFELVCLSNSKKKELSLFKFTLVLKEIVVICLNWKQLFLLSYPLQQQLRCLSSLACSSGLQLIQFQSSKPSDINQINMSHFAFSKETSIMSPRTKTWIEKQQRNLVLQSQFNLVNESLLTKINNNRHLSQETQTSKTAIILFQEKVEASISCFEAETSLRKKMESVSKSVKEIEARTANQLAMTSGKIKEFRNKVCIQLARQRQVSEETLALTHQNIEKMTTAFKKTQHINSPIRKQELKDKQAILQSQLAAVEKQTELLRREGESNLDNIANELEKKITEWKKRLISLSHADEQVVKELRDHIEVAQSSIEEEIRNERAAREENKEKLLLLLQTKAQKLGKK